jgi:hypothetical protein
MSDGESSQTGGVPDFFYELIARIIPGVVVVAISIYWSKGDFKTVYSSVGLSVFMLVAAWIIGVTLDIGVFAGYKLCPEKYRQKITPDLSTYAWILRKLLPFDRKLVTKALALIVFFRIMTIICVFALLICVAMLLFPRWDFFLPALHDHFWRYGLVSVILALVFGICWNEQHRELDSWFRSEAELLSKDINPVW